MFPVVDASADNGTRCVVPRYALSLVSLSPGSTRCLKEECVAICSCDEGQVRRNEGRCACPRWNLPSLVRTSNVQRSFSSTRGQCSPPGPTKTAIIVTGKVRCRAIAHLGGKTQMLRPVVDPPSTSLAFSDQGMHRKRFRPLGGWDILLGPDWED